MTEPRRLAEFALLNMMKIGISAAFKTDKGKALFGDDATCELTDTDSLTVRTAHGVFVFCDVYGVTEEVEQIMQLLNVEGIA